MRLYKVCEASILRDYETVCVVESSEKYEDDEGYRECSLRIMRKEGMWIKSEA